MKFQLGGRPAWLSLCTNCGKQKRYLQIFREVCGVFQQNFNGSKYSAVLKLRTWQFLRTWSFEAKAKDFRLRGQGQGQGLQNVSSRTSSRPRTSSRTTPLMVTTLRVYKAGHRCFRLLVLNSNSQNCRLRWIILSTQVLETTYNSSTARAYSRTNVAIFAIIYVF